MRFYLPEPYHFGVAHCQSIIHYPYCLLTGCPILIHLKDFFQPFKPVMLRADQS